MVKIAFIMGEYPPEQKKLRADAALSYATPEIEIGVKSVPFTPFAGVPPSMIQQSALHFHAAFIEAEKEGYNAIVPLGFLDLGVEGGRSLVDIPVIAPFEAALHVASQLGDRIGIVAYTEESIPKARLLARIYGMEHRIVGYGDSGVFLRNMQSNKETMIQGFLAAARKLMTEHHADVIIPGGITMCPVHMKPDWLSRELGVPVVEGIGAPIRMAALLAGLGLRHSRKRWPKGGGSAGG